jgi:hypothetical protein
MMGSYVELFVRSLPPNSEDEEHVFYVATLWPSMSVSMNVDPVTGERISAYYPLLHLVDKGILNTLNSERVVITKGEGNIRYGIQFTKEKT